MQGVILPPLPRKHWAAIGYTKIGQIGQPIYTLHCVESFENLLQVRGMGCGGKFIYLFAPYLFDNRVGWRDRNTKQR